MEMEISVVRQIDRETFERGKRETDKQTDIESDGQRCTDPTERHRG